MWSWGRAPHLLGVGPTQEIAQPEKPIHGLRNEGLLFHKIWVLLLALIPESMCVGQTPTLTPQNRTFGLLGGCGLYTGLKVMTGQLSRSEV